jgi:hypothetical protein
MTWDRWTALSGALALVEISFVVVAMILGRHPLWRVAKSIGRQWRAVGLGALAGLFCALVAGPIAMVVLYDPLGEIWSSRIGIALAYALVLLGATRGYMIGAKRSTLRP